MSATATMAPAPPTGLPPRDSLVWALAFAIVLAAHLAVGLALLQSEPATGPVEAAEPIAMIDLPPAPVLPDAVAAVDLPPSAAQSVPLPEAQAIGGSTVPDIAPEAPEPIEAPLAASEQLPPETAPPPPVPTVRPADAIAAEAVPPETAAPVAAEALPPVETAEAAPVAPAEAAAAEPPPEAAPVVPDAAVTLPGPVALPRVKPDVPPPAERPQPAATQAKTPDRKTAAAKPQKPAAPTSQRKTAETPAARKPAGPAADTPKAGARPQSAASAPRAAGGGPVADALKQYQAKVRADIEREVRRMQHSGRGRAAVRLAFNRNGTLTSVDIATTSGNPAIDRAILQAVKRASPFPAAPADLTQASFNWTIGLRVNN